MHRRVAGAFLWSRTSLLRSQSIWFAGCGSQECQSHSTPISRSVSFFHFFFFFCFFVAVAYIQKVPTDTTDLFLLLRCPSFLPFCLSIPRFPPGRACLWTLLETDKGFLELLNWATLACSSFHLLLWCAYRLLLCLVFQVAHISYGVPNCALCMHRAFLFCTGMRV